MESAAVVNLEATVDAAPDATVAVAQWATKLARAQSSIARRTMSAWDLEVSAVFDGGRD